MSAGARRFFAEYAWLGGHRAAELVLIATDAGVISEVSTGVDCPPDAVRLPGLVLPGLANAHSHAFHRALRGHSHRGGGSFWTWREDMYAVAGALDPERYYALARATYAEMALAGITCVGEFHYLHHDRDGARYGEANVMGEVLIAAAHDAGIRITLLDTCYLAGGFGRPLEGAQRRFGDGDVEGWAARAAGLTGAAHARVGAAIHSVRAVPADQLAAVATWARERGVPLHFHLSEQTAENDACLAAHGRTPTALLEDHGALGPRSCAVHATHLSPEDIGTLGGTRTTVCLCPSTERDLADGIGPARALASAGAPLALGSDSHAIIDGFEETRALELGERLARHSRGHFSAAELLSAATVAGHTCLGWPEAGQIAPGAPADLIAVGLDSVRLAGARPDTLLESVIFAAGAPDVAEVIVGGRTVVADGRHQLLPDVAGALAEAIAALEA
ncbi:formimidoylglutamate deiminase [Conexibacter sp. DBS9H8]|uniref:formimidoylglutamate deiminase n=1 Tax=Conexibacter sp. DBS9H8 TaxID=2937801 RepID=UPI00200E71CD|nr:formimidoylglutamate deiminase [Conexibacter sp. DBS9H8]